MNNEGRGLMAHGSSSPRSEMEVYLFDRLQNLLRIGKVSKVDYAAGKAQVSFFGENDSVVTHWLPWTTGRAGKNRRWRAPEVGEQVMVMSPHGNITGGVIADSINCTAFPHEASDGDRELEVFDSKAKGFREVNRADWTVREYLNSAGTLRFEIGPPQSITEGSGIVMDAEHIQLRVGATQLTVREGVIRMQIDGQTSEIELTAESLSVQVAGNAALSMTAEQISAELVQQQVRALLTPESIRLMVKEVLVELTNAQIDLSAVDSRLRITPPEIKMDTPAFTATEGSASAAEYQAGGLPTIALVDTKPPPSLAVGNPPTTPAAP